MAKEIKKNEKLIEFFKNCGMSKYAISKKSGLSIRTLYNWIDGTSTPTLESLEMLAQTVGKSFSEIRELFK